MFTDISEEVPLMNYHARTTDKITPEEIAHSNTVRKLAGECVVILENDGTLPIEKPGKVALYGNGARHTIKGGTGSGDVNSRYVVNIDEGLKEAGFEIVTGAWLDRYDAIAKKNIDDYMTEVRRRCAETGYNEITVMLEYAPSIPPLPVLNPNDDDADTAIYVLSRDSGEGYDRKADKGDFFLTDDEETAFETITSSYARSILVLNVGGIISLGKYAKKFSSVVLLSQLGNLTGNICADVITGKSDPCGRLTDTWDSDYYNYPNSETFSLNNGNTDDEYYTEGPYIGYRYFDSFGIKPDYPFGYGLGYTSFDTDLKSVKVDGLDVEAQFNVANIGSRAGKEVVQVYVASPHEILDKPFKELVAFVKTDALEPGQQTTVTASFNLKQIASYCDKCESKVLEAGDYYVLAGSDSENVQAIAKLIVKEDIETEHLKNVFGTSGVTEEYTNPGKAAPVDDFGVEEFVIDASGVKVYEAVYREESTELIDKRTDETLRFEDVLAGKATVEELVAQLAVDQMAALCVGDFGEDLDLAVVGNASVQVPGAAAETISTYEESRGIPSMILADGPAGLRLYPHFKAKDGKKLPGGDMFGLSFTPFPEDTPADAEDYYQYCTAIPIATALAQSFNMELIREIGYVVGEEMKEYFVQFWLAPGMNIHRNPLCGRNFEYYSEDPFLSGMCASAMTDGVQKWGIGGTTIKHFCCNNQETNRMYSNSRVTERTLRNLYLRGFELAVRKSQPYSVMSSYNLLNGIHTANHIGLCKRVLRDEWGFEGVVMTDWFTSQAVYGISDPSKAKYPHSSSVECIRSGNDWQMPGCKLNVTDIIDAVNDGSLPKADLQWCTCNIIRMAVKCFKDGRAV